MKKNYKTPMTIVVEMKMQSHLMELSLQNVDANSAAMSRGGSNWEDED